MTRTPPPAPPSPRSLARDVEELEALLVSQVPPEPQGSPGVPPESHESDLSRLGDPRRLDLLFRVLLGTLLRRGPAGEGLRPAELLEAAARAAAAGALPATTAPALRCSLAEAGARLCEAGAWEPARAAWWEPLPGTSGFEGVLAAMDAEAGLPTFAELVQRFGESGSPGWTILSPLLSPRQPATAFEQLEQAFQRGHLTLEPGAVGAAGRVTALRTDFAGYFTGLEPGLLRAAPAAALLVQWMLDRLPPALAAARPRLHAPQMAMLARYPAPSRGFEAHLDNPGGDQDNHRCLTVVLYLNPPDAPCGGGDLALWESGRTPLEAPAAVVPPRCGRAAVFDSRRVPHQVRSLAAGPPRWALTLWLSDVSQQPPAPEVGPPSVTELLLPLGAPPLPSGNVLFHRLDGPEPRGQIEVLRPGSGDLRCGIVSTVHGAGDGLESWCEHHLALGFDHLLLVFDHLGEASEAELAQRLARRIGKRRLTIWSGEELLRQGWPGLEPPEELCRLARGGSASHAHAARQTLNASLALAAARGDSLGGAPLDWLLHLDADERFLLQGNGRGGASLREHFAAARAADLVRLRYLNHELLLPVRPPAPLRFKLNPRLAAARLGKVGWASLESHLGMRQDGPRPYFRAYHNGKSAVAVAAGRAAAGVHGWALREGDGGRRSRTLAGPVVLHLHLPTAEAFRRTYRTKAAAPAPDAAALPFTASPLEEAALALLRGGDGAPDLDRELDELYRSRAEHSAAEIEVLEAAGLLLEAPEAAPDGGAHPRAAPLP